MRWSRLLGLALVPKPARIPRTYSAVMAFRLITEPQRA
jgi:hypothetical protein